ncbi:MAG: asparaginase [Lachnospiraceae bacterium]
MILRKNRLLVIFTGGTMGSIVSGNTIDVADATSYKLLEDFTQQVTDEIEFESIQPYYILSENCLPKNWELLIEAIRRTDVTRFDGIIITHGTDTLAYTAGILSFALGDCPLPIVLTASNYTYDSPHSDALLHFKGAVEYIYSSEVRGVYVAFSNREKEIQIHLGSRVLEGDSYSDEVRSYAGVPWGRMLGDTFEPQSDSVNPSVAMLQRPGNDGMPQSTGGQELWKPPLRPQSPLRFTQTVFCLRAYPGLSYDQISFTQKPGAILHSLYHSGTACTQGENTSLLHFIERCTQDGIPVYLHSFKDTEAVLYSTNRQLMDSKAVILLNISFEAAYTKLLLAYNQKEVPAEEFMQTEIFYEYLQAP